VRRNVQTNVFDKFRDLVSQFGSEGRQQQQQGKAASYEPEAEDDGADMVRIDTDSRGGLGSTTEDVFGPLVSDRLILEYGYFSAGHNPQTRLVADSAQIPQRAAC
jgi:hypothetical protein